MSASLVGSEMCIRDRAPITHLRGTHYAVRRHPLRSEELDPFAVRRGPFSVRPPPGGLSALVHEQQRIVR
eukprot:13497481-Alexandrium_andersonii.AAC.1